MREILTYFLFMVLALSVIVYIVLSVTTDELDVRYQDELQDEYSYIGYILAQTVKDSNDPANAFIEATSDIKPKNVCIYLTDDNGDTLAYTENTVNFSKIESFNVSEVFFSEYFPDDKFSYIIQPVERLNYKVVTVIDFTSHYESVNAMRRNVLIISFVIIVIISGGFSVLSNKRMAKS